MANNYLSNFISDPLRRNSILLISSSALSNVFGFVLWILAARLYSVSDVGLAAAILSGVNLLANFAKLGLDFGVIRFLPEEMQKTHMINTCLTITSLFSILLVAIYICGLHVWSPALLILREKPLYLLVFLCLVLFYSLFWLFHSIFIAFRATQFALIQMLIFGLRMVFVFVFMGLGLLGILSAFAVAIGIAMVATFFFVHHLQSDYFPRPFIQKDVVKNMIRYSSGNYVASSFQMLPTLVLPILIVNVMSEETSAHFYMAWMCGTIISIVTGSTCASLIADIAHNQEKLQSQLLKAIKFIMMILVPAIVLLLLFGNLLLRQFGPSYAEAGTTLLQLLAFSSLFVMINSLYISLKRIEKKVIPIIGILVFEALITLVGGYLLLDTLGITGIGMMWMAGQILVLPITLPEIVRTVKRPVEVKKV
jgi:O-antigen/teichoic acid export membrane protein